MNVKSFLEIFVQFKFYHYKTTRGQKKISHRTACLALLSFLWPSTHLPDILFKSFLYAIETFPSDKNFKKAKDLSDVKG